MALFLWIVRIVVVLLVVRMVVRMFTAQATARRQAPGPRRPAERLGGTLVRDPNCGTYIPQTTAIAITSGESTAFFCSTRCRDAWAASHRS